VQKFCKRQSTAAAQVGGKLQEFLSRFYSATNIKIKKSQIQGQKIQISSAIKVKIYKLI
jgi:hypothetical protein